MSGEIATAVAAEVQVPEEELPAGEAESKPADAGAPSSTTGGTAG
jgi:hypothetical protein